MRRRPWLLSALLAVAVAVVPRAALARGHSGSPASTFAPGYLDSDRCRVLTDQWDSAPARPDFAKAAALAQQGLALCRAGDFAHGADSLEYAVRLIGETPATPRPVIRLH